MSLLSTMVFHTANHKNHENEEIEQWFWHPPCSKAKMPSVSRKPRKPRDDIFETPPWSNHCSPGHARRGRCWWRHWHCWGSQPSPVPWVFFCQSIIRFREEQTRLFLNHAFALSDTHHFRRPFRGSEERNLCFRWVECNSSFRRFRQNGPFLAGDKNTVYQKHGLCHSDSSVNVNQFQSIWLGQKRGEFIHKQKVGKTMRNYYVTYLSKTTSQRLVGELFIFLHADQSKDIWRWVLFAVISGPQNNDPKYCPRRNYYWINSEKGGSSNFQDLFTEINLRSDRLQQFVLQEE